MNVVQDLLKVNYTPKGLKAVRGIVLHSMGGFFKGTQSWFKNPDAKASANYLISKEGDILQMVDETKGDMAWHAGITDPGKCPAWASPNPNFYCIGIELEDEKQGANWRYPEAQKQALRELVNFLMGKYSIAKDHVLLHRELNPSRRSDPVGDFSFDWLFPVATPVPVPPANQMEKLPKDNVIKDVYTALCGGFSEDEIKWRLSTGKNIVEIATDICGNDGRFFDKWVRPALPPIVEPAPGDPLPPQDPPLPGEPCNDIDCMNKVREIVASKPTFIAKLSFLLSLLK